MSGATGKIWIGRKAAPSWTRHRTRIWKLFLAAVWGRFGERHELSFTCRFIHGDASGV